MLLPFGFDETQQNTKKGVIEEESECGVHVCCVIKRAAGCAIHCNTPSTLSIRLSGVVRFF